MNILFERKKEKSVLKKKIEKAALKLFLKEGIERVTMRSIASEIKYSPATIYNYYNDKNDIFITIRQNAFLQFQSYQEKSRTSKNGKKRLLSHGKAYLKFALENPELYELMFIIKAPIKNLSHDDIEKSNRSFDYLKDDIELCMKQGLIEKGDTQVVALSFWAIVHGLASLMIRDRLTMFKNKDIPKFVENSGEYLFDSLINTTKLTDKKG